jgi:hypothetical protein
MRFFHISLGTAAIAHLFWIFTFHLNSTTYGGGWASKQTSTNLPNARETVLTIWFGTLGSTLQYSWR